MENMYYTIDGKLIDKAENERIQAENQKILAAAEKSGDISLLKNIVWTFNSEVYQAISAKDNREV